MSKGKILYYDDDPDFTSQFEILMDESGFEIVSFNDIKVLREHLSNAESMQSTKALIFDLAKNETEQSVGKDFEIVKDIKENFNHYRIPIFIHSAFATTIDDFLNCGTVWKMEKSAESLSSIVDCIEGLDGAGFFEVFTPGGILEQTLFSDLHRSFTSQFREGEIEKIITSINKDNQDYKTRTIEVFKRIAVRSLLSDVLAPSITDMEGVNPIEHYYRRISTVDIWTGDVLVKKKDSNNKAFLVITPRCNIMRDANILVCPLILGEFPTGRSKVKDALTNKPEYSGYNRFLPPSPTFAGGKVILSQYLMLSREELNNEFDNVITLSDELTNEILGKFGAYFFRTGITPFSTDEALGYINNQQE